MNVSLNLTDALIIGLNSSLIGKVASVGTGAAAIRSHRAKKRSRKEEAAFSRANARKSRKR